MQPCLSDLSLQPHLKTTMDLLLVSVACSFCFSAGSPSVEQQSDCAVFNSFGCFAASTPGFAPFSQEIHRALGLRKLLPAARVIWALRSQKPKQESEIGCQNLYTNTVRGGPPQTPGTLFGVYVFSFFSLENKLSGIHQTSFLTVEALELLELKTPLVYTFCLQ